MRNEITFAISPQHPAFPGHFPAMPIVPGVVLLDEVLRAIEMAHPSSIAHVTVAWAKFRSVVGPGESLTLHYEQRPDGSIMFVIRTPLRVVADGVMTLSLSSAEALDVF
jgi:3-hydroxyacyl-[acyl-carrier-protein] dehydratase